MIWSLLSPTDGLVSHYEEENIILEEKKCNIKNIIEQRKRIVVDIILSNRR